MLERHENFLSPDCCGLLYNYILSSLFRIGWEDSGETQHRSHPNLYSSYSFKDVQKLKILPLILDKLKSKKITIDNYDKCIVNLTKPMDVNFLHVHPKQIVALHYSSLTWNPEWGGETIFYEDNKKEIKHCSPYTPNKLIIFDGSIPHTIKAQNIMGPAYRFTTSIFFNR
mgnify:FL=1|jgi:Rps23 Pro-64 3,4-dihydroxylase Tpa1-like proline 4-hydroxylase